MTDKVFLDTNVIIYSLDQQHPHFPIAEDLLARRPVISVQVINESLSVQLRKLKRTPATAQEVAVWLLDHCEVIALEPADVRAAIDISRRYPLSHWDALIVASALRAGCGVLYSEDMRHGLWVTPSLQILNPFAE